MTLRRENSLWVSIAKMTFLLWLQRHLPATAHFKAWNRLRGHSETTFSKLFLEVSIFHVFVPICNLIVPMLYLYSNLQEQVKKVFCFKNWPFKLLTYIVLVILKILQPSAASFQKFFLIARTIVYHRTIFEKKSTQIQWQIADTPSCPRSFWTTPFLNENHLLCVWNTKIPPVSSS